LLFFLKAGSLTFGSGLVIVPFLQQGVVQQHGWLDERQFLIAVAVGMISPGPVVITATFVGYLVAGFWGSLVSTIGIFFPSFIFILVAAPLLARHGANPNVQVFVRGGNRHYPWSLHFAGPNCHRRLAHSPYRLGLACGLIQVEGQQSAVDCSDRRSRPDCLPIAAASLGDGEIAWKLKRRGSDKEKTKSVETPCIDDGGSAATGCRHN
jgi:hypothetical protein